MLDISIPIFLGKLGKLPFRTARLGIQSGAAIDLNIGDTEPLHCQIIMPRPLTAFDGRVYSAICGLHNADMPITPMSIYHATGTRNTAKLCGKQRVQILETVDALLHTTIALTDESVKIQLLTGSIAPGTAEHGQFTPSVTIMLDKPPGLYEYTRRTDKYLSMVPVEQLILPDTYRTDTIIATQTYAFERMLQARHAKFAIVKISFDALFHELAIDVSHTYKSIPHWQATRYRAAARKAFDTVFKAAVSAGVIAQYAHYPDSGNLPLHKCNGIEFAIL